MDLGYGAMDESVLEAFRRLDVLKRKASIAEIGGFRPPEDPLTSWFGGRGVGLPGEELPVFDGRQMFPLLQVRIDELPYVPDALDRTKLFVLFLDRQAIPFDRPHGEGWLIREYSFLEGLRPLPAGDSPPIVRPFPIRWHLSEEESPGWEDAWELVDLTAVNESEEASETFFNRYTNHVGTKVGGYATEIQSGAGLQDFVFQVGSEGKAGWQWVDGGVGHFFCEPAGSWRFSCQFY